MINDYYSMLRSCKLVVRYHRDFLENAAKVIDDLCNGIDFSQKQRREWSNVKESRVSHADAKSAMVPFQFPSRTFFRPQRLMSCHRVANL
ncbi:hypothetical protein HZH66_007216 [Vespula vulgaris]|uniref:Uncharacterized protein n=1 Tax=Vespula vulgaris TaxID=7454 RepID=A0A834JX61_VESVU|nr:hypothetical protein HZH66_007216 [Vespula vulgaris]